MTITQKQLKINKLFRKGTAKNVSKALKQKPEEDLDDLQDEIKELELRLREKQNELFQIQRNRYRHNVSVPKEKNDTFVRPQKIILKNSVESLQNKIEVMSMLTGVEVQSYVAGDHFCVVFHMQHPAQYDVKHGLRIEMAGGINEISSSNLPLGFNLSAVLEDFDNVKKPECLGAIRKALVAYYDRLEQFQVLKKHVNVEADLFKTLDGSHVEITLNVESDRQTDEEDAEEYRIVLLLDYRVYDIRPKTYAIKDSEVPDEVTEALRDQCAVFRKQTLRKAFKEAFVNGYGQYKLVRQLRPVEAERARRRPRARAQHYANDETFRPEECSQLEDEQSD